MIIDDVLIFNLSLDEIIWLLMKFRKIEKKKLILFIWVEDFLNEFSLNYLFVDKVK
jgi:cadmium resistance protein CadD (predicted permease)